MNRLFAAIALATALSACANPLAINPADAERDAREALAGGDNHLVGVCGFSCAAPGATPLDEERLGVQMIENTSGYIRLFGEAEYNDRAREYAVRYDRVIWAPHD
ncbi:MAG: hypothetical protein M0D54_14105 [Hyphomonadaceae bacterium JAD_PAG50586_4]|nr:MAG: hypothetical protein M0D54_14105 [Hyphomonadaceae bacterium JAD_PAG50586_4]